MPNAEGKDYSRLSQDFLDNLGFFDIEFQLTDKVPHKLKRCYSWWYLQKKQPSYCE